eukprot:549994_1
MSTKKKTILRIKRKFSDLPAVDTIVLSQTTQPKKQKTVPWTELCQSFDKNFTINDNDNDKNKNCNEKKVDTNIDFNFNNCKPKSKKQVFRLISNEKEISRHFQQNTFNEKYSKNRKSKILQQRRSNRQNYFEKIKKEINNNDTNNNNNNNNNNKNNNNILQHDDFCDNTNAINTKAKPINKNKNIKMIQNKLLQKQKLNRTTKIVSKKQIKEHQKQLKLKAQNNNNNNNNNKNNNNILQHDDFCDNTNAINTKAKPINKNKNIKMIQNKLLQKQKLNRTTKIVSKKQIKEHQKQLKLKAQNNNNNNNNKNNNNILQHDDFCDNTNAINTKAKPINKNKNIKMIQNKLLQKQKLNRTTKIVSKKQIKEHQKQLKLKAQNNNNNNN